MVNLRKAIVSDSYDLIRTMSTKFFKLSLVSSRPKNILRRQNVRFLRIEFRIYVTKSIIKIDQTLRTQPSGCLIKENASLLHLQCNYTITLTNASLKYTQKNN